MNEVEVIPNDPFREFLLTGRQYWVQCWEELKETMSHMTMDEYLRLNWQNYGLAETAEKE